ncbi:MAG: Flp1 family type IVb pilin [Deltaproteobacteria bacterium]
MLKSFKDFIIEDDGLGTVEIVLIIAILVGLALLFKKQIVGFVAKIMGGVVNTNVNPGDIENTTVR